MTTTLTTIHDRITCVLADVAPNVLTEKLAELVRGLNILQLPDEFGEPLGRDDRSHVGEDAGDPVVDGGDPVVGGGECRGHMRSLYPTRVGV